jgi:hypothetical protein
MTFATLLKELTVRRALVSTGDGRFYCRLPIGSVRLELRQAILFHKSKLLTLLSGISPGEWVAWMPSLPAQEIPSNSDSMAVIYSLDELLLLAEKEVPPEFLRATHMTKAIFPGANMTEFKTMKRKEI